MAWEWVKAWAVELLERALGLEWIQVLAPVSIRVQGLGPALELVGV